MLWHSVMLALVLVLVQFILMKLDAVVVKVISLTAHEAQLSAVTRLTGTTTIEDIISVHTEVLEWDVKVRKFCSYRAVIQTWIPVRCSYQLSYWSSGIKAEKRCIYQWRGKLFQIEWRGEGRLSNFACVNTQQLEWVWGYDPPLPVPRNDSKIRSSIASEPFLGTKLPLELFFDWQLHKQAKPSVNVAFHVTWWLQIIEHTLQVHRGTLNHYRFAWWCCSGNGQFKYTCYV